jgi:glutamyl-tRNA reductase
LVDLSVPRNIDPRVNELEDTFLYNVDDLSEIVNETKSNRKGEAERAEQIVLEEARNYQRAASAQQATPTVVALRRRIGAVLRAEHDKSQRGKLRELSKEQHEAIARMHDAAINKLLHGLTTRLREAASNPEEAIALESMVGALTELFELDSDELMMNSGENVPSRASKTQRRQERPSSLDERPTASTLGDSR